MILNLYILLYIISNILGGTWRALQAPDGYLEGPLPGHPSPRHFLGVHFLHCRGTLSVGQPWDSGGTAVARRGTAVSPLSTAKIRAHNSGAVTPGPQA